jgi:hypothetical protein
MDSLSSMPPSRMIIKVEELKIASERRKKRRKGKLSQLELPNTILCECAQAA